MNNQQRKSLHKSNEAKRVASVSKLQTSRDNRAKRLEAGKNVPVGPVNVAAANKALPKDVAEKYEVAKWPKKGRSLRFIMHPYGDINLTKITLKKAEHLVKMEFPHLVAKKS